VIHRDRWIGTLLAYPDTTLPAPFSSKGSDDSLLSAVKTLEFEEGTGLVTHDIQFLHRAEASLENSSELRRIHGLDDSLGEI
jgi:hypothetical protein